MAASGPGGGSTGATAAATGAVPTGPTYPRFLRLAGHPLRWRLLAELSRGDLRVRELCAASGERQSLVSYHLRMLRRGGLVSARRSLADGRDTYYALDLGRCGELLADTATTLHPALGPSPATLHPALGRGRDAAAGFGRDGAAAPADGGSAAPPSAAPVPAGTRILFLCTGNSGRSQIAEALTAELSAGAVEAASAGSNPKPVHPDAIAVMRRRGVDLGAARSKSLDVFAAAEFDQVVTLCDRVREVCPEFPGAPARTHWSVPDPVREADEDGSTLAAFERVAAELERRIGFLLGALAAGAP